MGFILLISMALKTDLYPMNYLACQHMRKDLTVYTSKVEAALCDILQCYHLVNVIKLTHN